MRCKNSWMIDLVIIIFLPKSHICIIPIFFKLKLIGNLVFDEFFVLWLPNEKTIIDLKFVCIYVNGIEELVFIYHLFVKF